MFVHPGFDPVAIQVGPVKVHWYGIMYLVAFLGCYWMARYRAKVQPLTRPMSPQQVGDWVFYGAIGVIVGARLGYCLFYQPSLFLDFTPLHIELFGNEFEIPFWGPFRIHQGGMSFHGGFLGVMVAMWLHGRSVGANFIHQTDFFAPVVPFGLFCGRIGNFINGELWGRPTDVPWAMVFPKVDQIPRHPSMLYEATLEGLALWALLWWFSIKQRPRGAVSAMFLIGYGVARFSVEFVRQPDAQLGFIAFGWVTMGHLLSLPMILLGIIIMTISYRRQKLRSS